MTDMTRYQVGRLGAFGIHLAISLAIFAVLAYLVLAVWYPDLFFATDGGWQGMRIIIAVDLVLGPLLTLVVFKPGKPGLKFDLSCIATLQAVCLIAGVWLVHSERPLAVIYADGHFSTLSQDAYVQAGVAVPDFDQFPGAYPKWIMVDIPENLDEQAALRQQMISEGKLLEMAVERYKPFDPSSTGFLNEALDAERLYSDADVADELQSGWLVEHGGSVDDYRFYPFGSRYTYAFLGYRRDSQELIGLLDAEHKI